CLTVKRPVSIWPSIVLRMLPFSTSTQCFACGTNQVRAAARSLTLLPSRLVAFGMFPFFSSACSLALLWDGTARVEPPRKPGIGLPLTWLGITNCLVTVLNFAPVQHVYQAGP